MDDQQLLRYSRQIMLPQLDLDGQLRLLESSVLIIGAGGLGSPVAMYLAAAGVGRLLINDFDTVELSNLQRQIIHSQNDIGRRKVDSAKDNLSALNSDIKVITYDHQLNHAELAAVVANADLVIDGSDNFPTRFAVNQACVQEGKPLVSGAAIRMEGQVSVFHPAGGNSPCYRCLYSETGEQSETCSETGVLAPVVGIIGSIQATEAIKLLSGMGSSLIGRVLMLDALQMEWRSLKLKKDPGCPVCSHLP